MAVTVTDDEGTASLSVADASVAEGDTGTADLEFAVKLSPASDGEVTVQWATSKESGDTAEPASDYTAGSGTLTFAAGETGKTVTVAVTGDQVDEPNETLTVTLSNQTSGVSISDATATGTITDDDATPTVSLALSPASIGEDGGVSTVTASLSGASSEEVDRHRLSVAGGSCGVRGLHAVHQHEADDRGGFDGEQRDGEDHGERQRRGRGEQDSDGVRRGRAAATE